MKQEPCLKCDGIVELVNTVHRRQGDTLITTETRRCQACGIQWETPHERQVPEELLARGW